MLWQSPSSFWFYTSSPLDLFTAMCSVSWSLESDPDCTTWGNFSITCQLIILQVIQIILLLLLLQDHPPVFCHETSHMALACPLLLHTKSDPFAWCLIVCLLQDQQSSSILQSNTSITCSTSNHSPCIHAILADPNNISDQDHALVDDPKALLNTLLSNPEPPCDVDSSEEQDFHLAC